MNTPSEEPTRNALDEEAELGHARSSLHEELTIGYPAREEQLWHTILLQPTLGLKYR